jgi:hypothetical protein
MKRSYIIYVCPLCDEQNQFAGFCDTCNVRLGLVRCVPITQIRAFESEASPQHGVTVDSLLEWASSSPSRSG